MIEIRQENKNDYEEIYSVVKTAFETAEHSDGNEQDLVVALRNSDSFIPELSLVAIKDDKIVGYILFTKIEIGNCEELALATLAVLPEYQKQGIGSKLVQQGHKIAKELGYHYSIVLGSETYYPKFGYVPAIQYGIKAPFEVSNENFMAIKLNYTDIEINGVIVDEYYKERYDENSIFTLQSTSKSITSAILGIAIDKGYIENVNIPISNYFPQIQESNSTYLKEITI